MSVNAVESGPWYRSLDRSQWNTLLATNLGWLFDGYPVPPAPVSTLPRPSLTLISTVKRW